MEASSILGQRPRERMRDGGAAALTDHELVAILVSPGSRRRPSEALARDVLADCGSVRRLASRRPGELANLPGMGLAKACRLVAALELGRRATEARDDGEPLKEASDVARRWARLAGEPDEAFVAIGVNARNRVVGEWVVARFSVLARFNIPVPVAGGLLFAALFLVLGVTGAGTIAFQTKTAAGWWTWLVTPEAEWAARPAKSLNLPLLVGFFTCIGLGAPVRVLRTGGRALLVLLAGATLLAVLQNAVGIALARALGAPPLLGVVCGALTLVGGHGTALGFASRFEEAGLHGAATIEPA